MAERAGKDVTIKVSGSATSTVGEATTSIAGNLEYQITDTAKRVLDKDGTIYVHKYSEAVTAEVGTTTTNITYTAHGLEVNDLVYNATRDAYRLVTAVPDVDNVTVAAVSGQTSGDTINLYLTEAATAYSLNRLNGKVTYTAAESRVIKISGDYLPMSTAAYARSASTTREVDLLDKSVFGDSYRGRVAGLHSASGSLTQIDVTDTTYTDALVAGEPIVLEILTHDAADPARYWAMIDSSEMSAAIEDLQQNVVTWVSYDEWLEA